MTTCDVTIAADGDDRGNGTPDSPLATPAAALRLLRAAPAGRAKRMIVSDGHYFDIRLALGPEDSGLTIMAADGAHPVWYGGRPVTGWRAMPNGWWAVPVPGTRDRAWDFNMLLMNGAWRPRARFPAQGTLEHTSTYDATWGDSFAGWNRKPTPEELTTVHFRPGDLPASLDVRNAEACILHEWDASTVGLTRIDHAAGCFHLASPTTHPPGAFRDRTIHSGGRFWLWNLREGMGAPGQWYLDRSQETLFYWPLPDERPETSVAIVPAQANILELAGRDGMPVRDLRITGLTFSVAAPPAGGEGFGACQLAAAVSITGPAANLELTDLQIRHVGGGGIRLHSKGKEQACQDICIRNCRVEEIGGTGIHGGGRRNGVADCLVANVGLIYPGAAGIVVNGPDTRVTGNRVSNGPYSGIIANGDRMRVERNHVSDVMKELHDGAAFYSGFGREMVLCHNHVENVTGVRARAYYLDQNAVDCIVEDNTAVNTPAFLLGHMARGCTWRNNVCINPGGLGIEFPRCENMTLEHNAFCAEGDIELVHPAAITQMTGNVFNSRTGRVWQVPLNDYARGEATPFVNPDPEVTRP